MNLNRDCFTPKGVTVARKLDKLGMRSSDTAEIYFDDVRVPAANVIGEQGKGFVYQMQQVIIIHVAGICVLYLNYY